MLEPTKSKAYFGNILVNGTANACENKITVDDVKAKSWLLISVRMDGQLYPTKRLDNVVIIYVELESSKMIIVESENY